MKKHIILGLLPILSASAYSADLRLMNNSPLRNRGTVEKAQTVRAKTSLSLGLSSNSNVRTNDSNSEISSNESLLTIRHNLFNELDLGISYINTNESNRDTTTSSTENSNSSNISLGLKYQFLRQRYLDAAVSTYIESGTAGVDTASSSSKSKIAVNGLASLRANQNYRINLQSGFKYLSNSPYKNFYITGELSEAIGFERIYKDFSFEFFAKARQLRMINTVNASIEDYNAVIYGANASADLDVASLQFFAEFSSDTHFGIPESSYGITISAVLDDRSSSSKAAPPEQESLIEEKEEELDVEEKANSIFSDDDAIRFKDHKEDPSLIMKELIDETTTNDPAKDEESKTEYEKSIESKRAFDKKFRNKKTEYQEVQDEIDDHERKKEIEAKKKALEEKKEQRKRRRELQRKIEEEKKFNKEIEGQIDQEVSERFRTDPFWEGEPGLDDDDDNVKDIDWNKEIKNDRSEHDDFDDQITD